MAAQFPIIKSAGSGLFEPDYVRALIAKAEGGPTVTRTAPRTAAQTAAVRKSAPAPVRRPLSKAAAAYAAEVQRLADERMARIVKAYAPPAPARPAVRKAKDAQLVACYDSTGNLIGVCPQDSVQVLAQVSAPAAKQPADGTAQGSGPRQAPPTQAPQAGPAAAAAADPSQPGAIPVGPNQLADDEQDAVAKMVNSGSLEGVVQLLKQRTLDGSARERREAGEALTALGLAKFAQIRAGGAQRQMKR
jgi:hypothetical protein